MIIGAPGSGKYFAAEHLKRQGFDLVDRKTPQNSSSAFSTHLRTSMDKLRDQLNASYQKDRNNVITVGSYWDSHLVYSEVLREMEMITAQEKRILDEIYSAYREPYSLTPPHAIIWTKSDLMSASNRMKLRGIEVAPDLHKRQIESFEKFVQKIRVPVIEIESAVNPEHTHQAIEFGVNSLKATALTSGTVWGRNMFYE